MTRTCLSIVLFGSFISALPLLAAAPCESLASLALPGTTITLSQSVPAGAFTPPGALGQNPPAALPQVGLQDLPAFCRVAVNIKPSKDSDIKVEVWMPTSGWNGKFMAVGNGGFAGTISYPLMSAALARGYATASTDTGHEGTNDGRFFGSPDKLIDFGYRAVHEMTLKAKLIIAAYYGKVPKFSYFNGCSTGGRQALKEAQRFPADYDGIVAGAASGNWTHLNIQPAWMTQLVHKDEANYIPPTKYALVHKAVLEACDARDGVKDGVIENPSHCYFDPKVLECKGADGPNCLTAPQVATAKAMYGGPINQRTRQQISPGLMPGSEPGWAVLAGRQSAVPLDYLTYAVFGVNSFDSITVLEQWVENKKAPDRIVASRVVDGKVERTRPLCPFPQVATYKGTGSTDDAANFSCTVVK